MQDLKTYAILTQWVQKGVKPIKKNCELISGEFMKPKLTPCATHNIASCQTNILSPLSPEHRPMELLEESLEYHSRRIRPKGFALQDVLIFMKYGAQAIAQDEFSKVVKI